VRWIKKTTDLLDFLFSVFGEETRRSQKPGGEPKDVNRALDTILENYGDRDAILLVESFVKRGRITLQGDAEVLNLPDTTTKKARRFFAQHNKARLSSKTDFEGEMRGKVVDACERFLTKNPKEAE